MEQTYGDAYFTGGGAGYRDYFSEQSLLTRHGRRYGRLLARYAPRRGRLLDVGAAAGFILSGLVESGWVGEGVEPNERMASHARDRLGLAVRTGTLSDIPPGSRFDAITCIQVAAHFVDPVVDFRLASRLLKPGGLLLIETWDRGSFTARLFGETWHEYSPPSVLHWWTPQVLRQVLAGLGYRQLGVGKPQKWIDLGHAASLLAHKLGIERLASLVPEGLAVPYPSEDLFWAVFRKW